MLFCNLILLILALSLGVAAIRMGQRNSLCTASEERFLPSGTSNGIDVDKPASCSKGAMEQNYYNAFFTLEDKSRGCYVTKECTPEDFFEIGFVICEIVAVLDEEFPKPSASNMMNIKDIKTDVCPMLGMWIVETNCTARRLMTSYTYKSGGTCHLCSSGCHHLSEGCKLSTPKDMASAACNLAQTCEFASNVSAKALKSINQTAIEIAELVVNFDKPAEAIKNCDEVKAISTNVKKELTKVKGEIERAKNACSEALKYANKGDEKNTKGCLVTTEDAVAKSMKVAELAGNKQVKAKGKKKEVEKKLIEQQWAKKEIANKEMFEQKEEELKKSLKSWSK